MNARILIGIAALLALGGGGWAIWAFGPEAMGGPARVDAGGGPIARLDSLSLQRRVVTASISGRVLEIESERDILLGDASGTITVRLEEEHGLQAGETLLVFGRVREASGAARRVDARAWSTFEAMIIPGGSPPDSVRLAPDSARFGTDSDRSPATMDRSPEER